jgi:hypothetical protein
VIGLELESSEAGRKLSEARRLLEDRIYEFDLEAAGLSGAVRIYIIYPDLGQMMC